MSQKNPKKCRNCGKKSEDNLSNRYCSEKCREEYFNKMHPIKVTNEDSGNYFDNFVDGRGF